MDTTKETSPYIFYADHDIVNWKERIFYSNYHDIMHVLIYNKYIYIYVRIKYQKQR